MTVKKLVSILLIVTILASFLLKLSPASAWSLPLTPGLKIVSESSRGITFEWVTPELEITHQVVDGQARQQLTLPEAALTAEAGQPRLPFISKLIGVPPAAEVRLEILADHFIVQDGIDNLIINQPGDQPDDQSPGVQPISGANLAVYPAPPAIITNENSWIRAQRIARLVIYPFQIRLVDNKLIHHTYLRIRLTFISGSNAPEGNDGQELRDPRFEALYRASVINYESARMWRGAPAQSIFPGFQSSGELTQNQMNTRYRISITQDGIYRLTYGTLQAIGLPVATVDPRTFHLDSQGQEIPIEIENIDGNSGVFTPGEAIVFYGQKFYGDHLAKLYQKENAWWYTFNQQQPDGTYKKWKPELNAAMLEKYTGENVYWLTYGSVGSPAIQTRASLLDMAPELTEYNTTVHAEQSGKWKTTLFTSVDTWFWEEIATSSIVTRTYQTSLSWPANHPGYATLRGEVVGNRNYSLSPDHRIQLYLNRLTSSDPLAAQPVFEGAWDGISRYHFETTVPQAQLINGTNSLEMVVNIPQGSDDLFFDWFEIEYARPFQAMNNQIEYQTPQVGVWKHALNGFTSSDIKIFDITQPLQPVQVTGAVWNDGHIDYVLQTTGQEHFWVGTPQPLALTEVRATESVDLSQSVDYLIITHADFVSASQLLADYWNTHGLTARVIDVNELYDQFNFGILNPLAIKNFLAYAFANWFTPPSYVLLVGDGHWNFKGYSGYETPPNYMPPNLVWVDPWQGEVDSANLLATVVGEDPLADLSIGRLPVNHPEEILRYVDRLQAYSDMIQNGAGLAPAGQDWRRHFLFISDNPDGAGNFEASNDAVIAKYLTVETTPERIYLNHFIQSGLCNPKVTGNCPAATQAIIETLNKNGALLVNFVGHASLNYWTNEGIFKNSDIPLLNNLQHLPVILSMDCLDGYWIHPDLSSGVKSGQGLIEELIRSPQGGAIAAFSPTGLGLANGHDELQQGFYDALYLSDVRTLGIASMIAKLRLFTKGSYLDLLQTFTIFGDPALELALPDQQTRAFMPLILR